MAGGAYRGPVSSWIRHPDHWHLCCSICLRARHSSTADLSARPLRYPKAEKAVRGSAPCAPIRPAVIVL